MKNFFTILLLILLIVLPCMALADWPCRADSAIAVSTAFGNQWNVHLVPDGPGGAIMFWQDRRNGIEDKIYCQRVDAAGIPQWVDGGMPLAVTLGYQYYPQGISDGAGGLFVVWQDNRYGSDYDIFIQHVSAAGIPLWFVNGTLVCNAAGHQYNPQLTSDGAGGVIVVWQDKRGGNFDIYAQRYTAAGQALWPGNGLAVCSAPGDQIEPKLVTDALGGAIVAWTDYRAGTGFSDVYAQRLLSNGQTAWADGGVPVCMATNTQWNVQLVADGAGGAEAVWQDRRLGTYDNIFAQRIDNAGQARWGENGIALGAVQGIQYYPQAASDGSGGLIAAWQDNRRGTDYDIYAQRVSRSGQLLWLSTGLPVCTASGHQYNPQLISQSGYALLVWQDRRGVGDYDIYTQRLDPAGSALWDANGTPVVSWRSDQFSPQLASDGSFGAIVAWPDYHQGVNGTDIFTNRIGANGRLAGGCYRSFPQSSFHLKPVKVYNRITHVTLMPNEGNVLDTIFRRGAYPQGIILGIERLDARKVYAWEYFTKAYYVRNGLPQNGTARPLDRIYDRPYHGILKNPTVWRYNNRLSGELLALKLNIAASDVGLTEPSFGEIIFKDPSTPSNPFNNKSLRQIAGFVDTTLTYWTSYVADPAFYPLMGYWLGKINGAFAAPLDTIRLAPLRLTPVGSLFSVPFLQANAAPPPLIPSFQPEPGDVDELPAEFALSQNYPNPFNPVTTIEFVLPAPATVTLKVYNVLGQEVATLFDRAVLDGGRTMAEFDGSQFSSGVYFYELSAQDLEGETLHRFLKKMLLVK